MKALVEYAVLALLAVANVVPVLTRPTQALYRDGGEDSGGRGAGGGGTLPAEVRQSSVQCEGADGSMSLQWAGRGGGPTEVDSIDDGGQSCTVIATSGPGGNTALPPPPPETAVPPR